MEPTTPPQNNAQKHNQKLYILRNQRVLQFSVTKILTVKFEFNSMQNLQQAGNLRIMYFVESIDDLKTYLIKKNF